MSISLNSLRPNLKADTGFGNVLDGLELNETATALIGSAQVAIRLSGAATNVRAFRACTDAGLA